MLTAPGYETCVLVSLESNGLWFCGEFWEGADFLFVSES